MDALLLLLLSMHSYHYSNQLKSLVYLFFDIKFPFNVPKLPDYCSLFNDVFFSVCRTYMNRNGDRRVEVNEMGSKTEARHVCFCAQAFA